MCAEWAKRNAHADLYLGQKKTRESQDPGPYTERGPAVLGSRPAMVHRHLSVNGEAAGPCPWAGLLPSTATGAASGVSWASILQERPND